MSNIFFILKGLIVDATFAKLQKYIYSIFCFGFLFCSQVYSQQLAFPTAEGYGKFTKGGRGGVVYEVTNLNDSGKGSLRAAVEAKGPRTVVFRISGTIDLKSNLEIKNPYITIAGQTAPGDGITLKRYPLKISADEVIIRYIRVRLGDESGGAEDAISSRYTNNIILDHVSASWSIDETLSIYHCKNVTVQWCMITESLFESNHTKGSAHGYGGIWGSDYGSYHHNLIAHHSSRNPRFASGCGNTDYRNNVLYNWGYQSCYGAETVQLNSDKFTFSNINMVGNYQKAGPATVPGEIAHRIVSPSSRNQEKDYGKWYIAENAIEGNSWVSKNNWLGGVQPKGSEFLEGFKLDEPWPAMPINQQTPDDAYASVLKHAGASLPNRDAVDNRIVDEVKNGYATYEGATYETHSKVRKVTDPLKKCGIIDTQDDVGGWPELKSLPAPIDSDHDGMPDNWEKENGLDPENASDRNIVATDGYTMLEKYLNNIL
ncbi:pectate lyase [uncultured Draconibacterium sp.]|uniref:pectate lyase family protein n=1 Tax=uncultured Draconibacterium sp. TaxID=1573823 RepID=UPI0025CC0537|nr:pectate lyase [uncultured Draconibacterium sp.]